MFELSKAVQSCANKLPFSNLKVALLPLPCLLLNVKSKIRPSKNTFLDSKNRPKKISKMDLAAEFICPRVLLRRYFAKFLMISKLGQ